LRFVRAIHLHRFRGTEGNFSDAAANGCASGIVVRIARRRRRFSAARTDAFSSRQRRWPCGPWHRATKQNAVRLP
jgi:hypothetical protein